MRFIVLGKWTLHFIVLVKGGWMLHFIVLVKGGWILHFIVLVKEGMDAAGSAPREMKIFNLVGSNFWTFV